MVIGLLRVQLHLPYVHSLKEKRSIVKKLIHRLRTGHNCAVSETEHQDLWQSAEISVVTVYSEKATAESLLSRLEKEFENHDDFQVTAVEIEYL